MTNSDIAAVAVVALWVHIKYDPFGRFARYWHKKIESGCIWSTSDMKSLPYGKLGNRNLKGKKSKALMAGKYVEDVIQNHKERERDKEARKEIRSTTQSLQDE